MRKLIGSLLIIVSILIVGYVVYNNTQYSQNTRTFSPYTILSSSWEKYKQKFISQDGRVIDYSQNQITTSEGQSYALLRAVWVDDKPTFDNVWKFTKDNLKRKNDNLFGWKWGQQQDGNYSFFPGGGDNSAADADTDIALALILASRRWTDNKYEAEAKTILNDIWKIETDTANGNRYLTAGSWASGSDKMIINPSYFAPYAWRIFAQVDTDHDWASLINPAYDLLDTASHDPLDKDKAVGLPPNWVAINKQTGELMPANLDGLTTDYSYDAIRIPWRIAIDYQWNKEPKAYEQLTKQYQVLVDQYQQQGKIYSAYTHDGAAVTQIESPSMYATFIGILLTRNQQLADKLYQEKLINLYSNTDNTFKDDIPYYEQNWLWFGVALYNKFLSPFNS